MDQLFGLMEGYLQTLYANPFDEKKLKEFYVTCHPDLGEIFLADQERREARRDKFIARLERRSAEFDRRKLQILSDKKKPPKKANISCPMIVKNEADVIERAIVSAYDLADEFCVVDTGSTDGTIELLEQYPKVRLKKKEIVPWDFSFARNISLAMCKGKTAFIIDADEELMTGAGTVKEEMRNKTDIFMPSVHLINNDTISSMTTEARIFPLDGNIHYKNPVHNTLAFKGKKYRSHGCAVEIFHNPLYSEEKINARKERTETAYENLMDDFQEDDFNNYYQGIHMGVFLNKTKEMDWLVNDGMKLFDTLELTDKKRYSDFLLYVCHVALAVDQVRMAAIASGRHNGLMGDTADNCFYTHCVFDFGGDYGTALEYTDRYLNLIEIEKLLPARTQETLVHYDNMLLKKDIYKYWREHKWSRESQ
jgi:glycosyltransferase involved in cell wall biosynthesis